MITNRYENTESTVHCQAEIGDAMVRIVICDDDPHFLSSLRSDIRKILNANKIDAVIHIYDCAENIPEQIYLDTDIFFLDIDFTGKTYTGIDIAKKIRKNRQDSIIVFVTNYVEYAPEGYEVQAFRYVLKSDLSHKLEKYLLQTIAKFQSEQETIQINIAGEIITVALADILYIESQGHLAILHTLRSETPAGKSYQFYATLTSLERKLSTQGFLRIQKSYLVNMRRIKKFQCNEAVLDNGAVLPVSEKNYAQQKKQYLLWKGRQ